MPPKGKSWRSSSAEDGPEMTDFENDPDYEECLVTFFDVLGFPTSLRAAPVSRRPLPERQSCLRATTKNRFGFLSLRRRKRAKFLGHPGWRTGTKAQKLALLLFVQCRLDTPQSLRSFGFAEICKRPKSVAGTTVGCTKLPARHMFKLDALRSEFQMTARPGSPIDLTGWILCRNTEQVRCRRPALRHTLTG